MAAGLVAFGCSGPGGKPVTPEPKEPSLAESPAQPADPVERPAAPEAPTVAETPAQPAAPVEKPVKPEPVAPTVAGPKIQEDTPPVIVAGPAPEPIPAGTGPVIPANLPRPDGKPGNQDKPVKVYILAGQSNMVGFGYLRGARPMYGSIYLSADPSIMPCRMPVGTDALLPHKLYQGPGAEAPEGAKAMIYAGAYNAGTDYAAMTPAKETTVALGTVAQALPSVDGPHTVVVKTFVEVPMTGSHEIHVGYQDSTHAIAVVDGKEAYRKEPGKDAVVTPVNLEEGKRPPLTITYLKGGSAALWLKLVNIKGKGDLTTLIKGGKFGWFVQDDGKWTTRNDVYYINTRTNDKVAVPLSPTANGGKFIGPEIPFGYVMGTYHDETVLLIESSIGNRALSFDFRPPSSGRDEPDNKWEGLEYRLMVEGAQRTLKDLKKYLPGYEGQGYEIAGFVWWQGHKDGGRPKEDYEKHLVNLIQDLRKDLKAPSMRAVVASVGFGGHKMGDNYLPILEAQMAVSDPKQHPEFAGTVASVDTRSYWRSPGDSPTGTGYHYNHNAETYVLTGDSLGREMVKLLGGRPEKMVLPPPPEKHPDVDLIYSDAITNRLSEAGKAPTPEQRRKMGTALRPILLEHMVPNFIAAAFAPGARPPSDPVYFSIFKISSPYRLADLMSGKPIDWSSRRAPGSADGQFESLLRHYQAAGLDEYGWKLFGPDTREAEWWYYSFDPPEKHPAEKSARYRKITFPKGMENWYAADFDPAAAGWKKGGAPFGQSGGKLAPRPKLKPERPKCYMDYRCNCDTMPNTLWEKEVLLMRRTFDIPPIKDGHLYRVILAGAGCDRSGEGFAVYVNGKLLVRKNDGFYKTPGVRGAYVMNDILPEFKKGKVEIAVINFLRFTHMRSGTQYLGKPVPPNGQVTVLLEEAKIPEVVLELKKD